MMAELEQDIPETEVQIREHIRAFLRLPKGAAVSIVDPYLRNAKYLGYKLHSVMTSSGEFLRISVILSTSSGKVVGVPHIADMQDQYTSLGLPNPVRVVPVNLNPKQSTNATEHFTHG